MDYFVPTGPVEVVERLMTSVLVANGICGQPIGPQASIYVKLETGTLAFHTLWGYENDYGEGKPYRKVTLRLEGRPRKDICLRPGSDLDKHFALLEFDPFRPFQAIITLSPVPFGRNHKPELPFTGVEKLFFLHILRILTRSDTSLWTTTQLWEEMAKINEVASINTYNNVAQCLSKMATFDLARWERLNDKDPIAYMSTSAGFNFEKIFDVQLPPPPTLVKAIEVTLLNSNGIGVVEANAYSAGEIHESQPDTFTQDILILPGQGIELLNHHYMAEYNLEKRRWEVRGVESVANR